jgi:SAM-dependent methyltransferase
MLLSFLKPINAEAEEFAKKDDLLGVLEALRRLSLDDFGALLLSMPDPNYPTLSQILPKMASPQVQESWTGASGLTILRQSLSFVRAVAAEYVELTSQPLNGKTILDFGCGYGRLLRLMLYFSNPIEIYGVDPWDASIKICQEDGIPCNLAISDYLPRSLPFPGRNFDFVYCFSVFTHLSERASRAALDVIRSRIKPNGVLVITIRPVEYWGFCEGSGTMSSEQAARLTKQHEEVGSAFEPHNRPPLDGDVTYGDTSMTIEYLTNKFPRWRIVRYSRTLDDPLQIILFMRPV